MKNEMVEFLKPVSNYSLVFRKVSSIGAEKARYWIDNGEWGVNVGVKDGRYFVLNRAGLLSHFYKVELVPCSRQEYDEAIGEYSYFKRSPGEK